MILTKQMFQKIIFSIVLILTSFFTGFFVVTTYASTNIDATHPNHFAWSSVVGWINLHGTNSVQVNRDGLRGFARFGPEGGPFNFLSFDCNSGPPGSSCSPVTYRVTNDATGNLSGFAWSDAIGWVSFNCNQVETGNQCASSNYQVRIDAGGNFTGWAWNDVIGWISFSCVNTDTCATINYRVRTAWTPGPAQGTLESGTFDTNRPNGAAFNFIVWRGELNGGRVSFQLATSNCANGATNAPICDANIGWGGTKTAGDGAFLGPSGTSASEDAYTMSPNTPVPIRNTATHNNRRFFRYRVVLETDVSRERTPIIQDVIVNWSP